jgi:mitochondrial inner membrane protease subunit 2
MANLTPHRSPSNPEQESVKRVIGLEGDVVHTRPPYPHSYLVVPEGHIWVEGDAVPGQTRDSNTWGPISRGLVTGRITHVLWPWRRAGRIRWWEHEDRRLDVR